MKKFEIDAGDGNQTRRPVDKHFTKGIFKNSLRMSTEKRYYYYLFKYCN